MTDIQHETTIATLYAEFVWKRVSVEEIADRIGIVDRDTYLRLKTEWKARYREISDEIRQAKLLRRSGDEKSYWQSKRETLRFQARKTMLLRTALTVVARRHWEAHRKLAAA